MSKASLRLKGATKAALERFARREIRENLLPQILQALLYYSKVSDSQSGEDCGRKKVCDLPPIIRLSDCLDFPLLPRTRHKFGFPACKIFEDELHHLLEDREKANVLEHNLRVDPLIQEAKGLWLVDHQDDEGKEGLSDRGIPDTFEYLCLKCLKHCLTWAIDMDDSDLRIVRETLMVWSEQKRRKAPSREGAALVDRLIER